MAYVGLLLAVVVDTAFQVLMPGRAGLAPDLPLITALYIGFHARNTQQLGLAVMLGAMADCFSSHPLGHFAFLFGASAYMARRTRRYLPPDAALSYVVGCLLCGIFYAFLSLGFAIVTNSGAIASGFGRALLEACTSALCAPFVFGLWDRTRLFRKALRGRKYEFA